MEHFFPRIQVDTYYAQMHTRVKLLGGCRCRPYSNYWGGYIPPPPGFGTPACDTKIHTKGHSKTLKRGHSIITNAKIINRLRAIWPKGYQRGSLRKSYQNGDYLKASNAKKLSSRRNRTSSLWITGPLLHHLS